MLIVLVLLSALLHAAWNAWLKRQGQEMDAAGVAVVGLSGLFSVVVAAVLTLAGDPSVFPTGRGLSASLLAGVFESGYFLCLVLALKSGPLSPVYTISRGLAILVTWPISALVFDEPVTTSGLAGTGLVLFGLGVTGFEKGLVRKSALWAVGAGLCIVGYHFGYKVALSTEASAPIVFALSLMLALPINLFRLDPAHRRQLGQMLRRRTWTLLGMGVVCGGSFLLFMIALRSGGAAFVLTLRNTSIVFAALLARWAGDPVSGRQVTSAALVTFGALALSA